MIFSISDPEIFIFEMNVLYGMNMISQPKSQNDELKS